MPDLIHVDISSGALLLPAEHIQENYEKIRKFIPDNSPQLKQLGEYMHRQWLNAHFHGVDGISVLNQSTRTNND